MVEVSETQVVYILPPSHKEQKANGGFEAKERENETWSHL